MMSIKNKPILAMSRPYTIADGEISKLCADISWPEESVTMWYGVERQFENYLIAIPPAPTSHWVGGS